MDQLLAHLTGDYIVQTDWMANEKTKSWAPALAHAASYTACFLPLTRDWRRLAVIGVTHAIIDHHRLARHLIWVKNQFAPSSYQYPWIEGQKTGYHDDRPDWLAVWLMIVADNTLHLLINRAVLGRR